MVISCTILLRCSAIISQEQLARQRRLQDIHSQQEEYWRQARFAAERGTGAGYDEATRILVELREVAEHFKENQEFQARFPYMDHVSSTPSGLSQTFTG